VSVDGRAGVMVGTTSRALTAYGGAELLRETMRVVGLMPAVDNHVRLKHRARGLSEGEFVAASAESVALGARCLDDLAVPRGDAAQEMLRGFPVPAPQTAGTWLRRFSLGHIRQLDKALAEVQRNAFGAAGVDQVTLDFDSSYVFSRSKRRQGADRTYKKGYALHPLFCFDAGSGAAVHARLRRGRAGASTGIGTFVTETLRRVPAGITVRARFDSGFYSGPLFDQLETAGVTYLCGVPLNPNILDCCRAIPDGCFEPCLDKDTGEVAEFGYRLRDGRRFRRYVVKRIPVAIGEQTTLETGGYHYWVLVTNDYQRSAPELESEHRHKADVESGVRELKENFGLHALRKHGFMVNWAWLLLVCLGHNLCCWTQQLGVLAAGRDGGDLRAKRLRYRYLIIPAMVVRTGRRLILKLTHGYPYRLRFNAALHRLRALPAPAG
jgi:hypothetical protein